MLSTTSSNVSTTSSSVSAANGITRIPSGPSVGAGTSSIRGLTNTPSQMTRMTRVASAHDPSFPLATFPSSGTTSSVSTPCSIRWSVGRRFLRVALLPVENSCSTV